MMVNSLTFVVGAVARPGVAVGEAGQPAEQAADAHDPAYGRSASGLGDRRGAGVAGPIVPDGLGTVVGAWVKLFLQGIVGIVVSFGLLMAFRRSRS